MIEQLYRRFSGSTFDLDNRVLKPQTGCIPYAFVDGQRVILLVTSRRTGRWVFPKGGLMEGLEPWESAAQEAYEEAGVEGHVDPRPVGVYHSIKQRIRPIPVEVTLYPLLVETQHDAWPEMRQRHRHWATIAEARRLIAERPLKAILNDFAAQSVTPE
ncbi:NUDIX hydrolase [Jiella sp. MQZ9-1]|uniref:NUDIX hydrolase n=1 Tax=Jiella flava TaxID=2816857 RepID=A0A939FXM4_9HYPH|nr:NUDIX hydrolase [Jiella flava]MBO0662641.1 NUDIX hydrolase [Jiella flava]MCD2471063.1 NUDIX hydrolase [Jiella flava]